LVELGGRSFSYNKKDLASGIESNAMCLTGIADYWVGCEVESDENYLNCHKLEGEGYLPIRLGGFGGEGVLG